METGGYSGIRNVYQPDGGTKDDIQQSFLLAETFKVLIKCQHSLTTLILSQYIYIYILREEQHWKYRIHSRNEKMKPNWRKAKKKKKVWGFIFYYFHFLTENFFFYKKKTL